ncbi:MAG: hypothetical protein IPJ40_14190 [Saprospirales bacterium]|nr:hypothetical protein [Saprospirales bacterium]
MEDETPLFGYPVRDARLGIKALREAFPFIRKHRLWTGVFSYGWLSRFFLVIGIIAGLNFFGILIKWIGTLRSVDDPLSYGASVLDLYSSLFDGGFFLFSLGGMKYIVLILTEVLLFHVVRRALEILKGGGEDTSLKAFPACSGAHGENIGPGLGLGNGFVGRDIRVDGYHGCRLAEVAPELDRAVFFPGSCRYGQLFRAL